MWIWESSKTPIATAVFHWKPGQPDNAGKDENCLEINNSGYWNDRPCHNFQKYICEMDSGYVQFCSHVKIYLLICVNIRKSSNEPLTFIVEHSLKQTKKKNKQTNLKLILHEISIYVSKLTDG